MKKLRNCDARSGPKSIKTTQSGHAARRISCLRARWFKKRFFRQKKNLQDCPKMQLLVAANEQVGNRWINYLPFVPGSLTV